MNAVEVDKEEQEEEEKEEEKEEEEETSMKRKRFLRPGVLDSALRAGSFLK